MRAAKQSGTGAAARRVTGRARLILAVGAIAVAATVLAGCAGGDTPSSSSSGGAGADVAAAQASADQYLTAPTTINQDVPLDDLPATGKFVYLNSGLPATTLMVDAAHEAVDAIGWDFQELSYDGANPATIRSAFLTALQSGATVVAISGNPPSVYGDDVMQQYKDAGVPIIVGSVCPLEVKEPLVQGALGCDAEDTAGRALADWFIADSNGTGQALFENVTSIPSLVAYVEAFTDEVTTKCPDCSVQTLETTLDQVGSNQVVPSVVNALRANPDLNYVFFDNAQWSKGIVAALKAAGLDGSVKVAGRSMDEGAQGGLKDGTQSAWTAFAYPVAGYAQVDAALRAVTGSGGLDNVSVMPLQLVTPDNVDGTTVPYSAPTDALDQYLALWGAK